MGTEYEPGVRCLVTYRLVLVAEGVSPWPTFGGVLVGRSGLSWWWYAEDPGLPGVGAAADGWSVRGVLAGWVDLPVQGCVVAAVRYRAGRRCLLRYEVGTVGGPRVVFGKVYGADAGRHAGAQAGLHAVLEAERRAGLCRPGVARPVGFDAGLGLVGQAAVPGVTLRELLFDAARDLGGRLRAVREVGAHLAGLHASGGVPGPLRTLGGDVADLRGFGPVVRRVDRVLAGRFARAVDLAAAVRCGWGDPVPSHGALRCDQVVVGGEGVVLLDLDTVGWADPARDVGNLLAYLAWRGLRRPAERPVVAGARAAFLAGYREGGGAVDEAGVGRWEAMSLLKIAGRGFRGLRHEQWPLVPRLVELAAATLPPRRAGGGGGSAGWGSALGLATDPARVTARLRALPWGGEGSGRPTVGSAEVLACRPGRAAVVRYRLVGGPGGEEPLLGKLYPDPGLAARGYAVHAALAGVLCGGGAGRVVPEPVGVLPGTALVVFRPVRGRVLGEVLDGGGGVGAVRAAAGWLAGLHGCPAVLDRRLDLRAEQGSVRAWARVVAAGLGELADPAGALADGLVAALGGLPGRCDAPIHKDFHYQHVLVGSPLGVIDLDEARMGDPSLDVAHFGVCLDLLALRGSVGAAAARAVFLGEYAARRGWRPDPAYRVFSAWTCLKIARQLATDRGPRPRPVGGRRLDQARAMLTGGLSWLG